MIDRVDMNRRDLIHKPLWFHKLNRQETRSGYGKKLRTPYMVKYHNRLHRIYVCQYSNAATPYIVVKGTYCIVNIVD